MYYELLFDISPLHLQTGCIMEAPIQTHSRLSEPCVQIWGCQQWATFDREVTNVCSTCAGRNWGPSFPSSSSSKTLSG